MDAKQGYHEAGTARKARNITFRADFFRVGPWHLFLVGRRAFLIGKNKLPESLGAAKIMCRANKSYYRQKKHFNDHFL